MHYYKNHIGTTSAVFVTEYKLKYLDRAGQEKKLVIFSSAHSDNSRQGAYEKTKILYEHGFGEGPYQVTRPLFFLPEQRAFFYQASPGRSLFEFFTQDPKQDLSSALKLAAGWIKKFHQLDVLDLYDWSQFATDNISPSPKIFVPDFYRFSADEGKMVEHLLKEIAAEDLLFAKGAQQKLIYGDYHPENIIIESLTAKQLIMIDFTDIAIGDPMVDLGIFIQQFDFMGHNFISREQMNKYKVYFLESYFDKNFDEIEQDIISRINLYQAWTAVRSAVFLFYMKKVENSVENLLHEAQEYLEAAKNNSHKINLRS